MKKWIELWDYIERVIAVAGPEDFVSNYIDPRFLWVYEYQDEPTEPRRFIRRVRADRWLQWRKSGARAS